MKIGMRGHQPDFKEMSKPIQLKKYRSDVIVVM